MKAVMLSVYKEFWWVHTFSGSLSTGFHAIPFLACNMHTPYRSTRLWINKFFPSKPPLPLLARFNRRVQDIRILINLLLISGIPLFNSLVELQERSLRDENAGHSSARSGYI